MTTTATTIHQRTLTFNGTTLVVEGDRYTATIVVRSIYELRFQEFNWGERGMNLVPKDAHFCLTVSYGGSNRVWDGSTYVEQKTSAAWYFGKKEGARARALHNVLRTAVSQ
jgi:hypothetical protein